MLKEELEKRLEGLGGWLFIYFIFCASYFISLWGLIKGLYSILMSGAQYIGIIFIFILTVLQLILLIISLDLIFEKKRSAKLWSILFLITSFILLVAIVIRTFGSLPKKDMNILLAGLVLIIVWIFYFIRSKRVKKVFTKS
jgi:hypothetical protein